jgi:aromatic ring-cleaving dioxygenase
MEMNFLKPKEVFDGNESLHKNLSQVFTQLSPFKRYEEIVGPYFSGIYQICFPEKSHGQQLTSHLINSNWRSDWIFSLII